jgi:hypothetical protein
MIVTTAGRTNDIMIQRAEFVANELRVKYVPRKKRSTTKLQTLYQDDLLVVGKDRYEIFPIGEDEPIFFHPNSAMFRVKRVLKGGNDPFLEATTIAHGYSVLDCTLGLASDSIVASLVVGSKGVVVGIEGNRYISYLVKNGLKQWKTEIADMNEAMKRIKVINDNYSNYLASLESNSFDVVYFDPMFESEISESDGIKGIKKLAIYQSISEDTIMHAKRVAKKRVVIKDYWQSERFNKFGFTVTKRPSAKFHFGYIDCQ